MTSVGKVVLVTGANRGLGLAILQVAGLQDPSANFILTCRDVEFGHKAAAQLTEDGVRAQIDVVQLDVTNDEQILEAVKYVTVKYKKLDVLVNNAGIITIIPDYSLPTLRKVCNEMMNVNLTSVAVVSTAFQQLLHNAAAPKIINITSGLGSIGNTLTNRKMAKYPPYGASKVGMNGVTAHMQVWEDERIEMETAEDEAKAKGRIRFYSVAPGLLNTEFTHYSALGKDPKDGAKAIVRLIADDKDEYPGGTQWEFEQDQMREVPW